MKVQVEEVSPIERRLSIEVEQGLVRQELEKAYNQLGRRVQIAGFRAGKVPRRILEQRFKRQVEDDVIQRVVEKAYLEAIREHKVEAVSSPRVTNAELKANEPFTFEARVEVKPRIEPRDYEGLPLKRQEVAVDESKINERLEQLRQNFARLEPIEGRDVAQPNDRALIDFSATVDGQPFEGSVGENILVEVNPGELVQSKVPALEGVKVGEKKTVDYTFPADYQVEAVKGKTAQFEFTLKALKTEVTPELNDDFAKETGGAETLEGLKARIRSDLEKAEKARVANEEREALFKALIERNPFEVPKAMLDRAAEMMLEGAVRQMARSGVDVRQMNLDYNALRDSMLPRAEVEVRGSLILEAIAGKQNIDATDEDFEKKVEELATEANQPVSQVRKVFKTEDDRRRLKLRIREEKTVEFLRARANYA